MEQKIYKKRNRSRLKQDFKFLYRYWWLRSVINDDCNCFSGCVDFYGGGDYIRPHKTFINFFTVCTI